MTWIGRAVQASGAVPSSVGDVYVQGDQAWRVQGVGFKCLTALEISADSSGERGQDDVFEGI